MDIFPYRLFQFYLIMKITLITDETFYHETDDVPMHSVVHPSQVGQFEHFEQVLLTPLHNNYRYFSYCIRIKLT
jgi:hypothetical protein